MAAEPEKSPLSRVWILTFFVMGIIIGLMLLLLQRGPVVEAPRPAQKPQVKEAAAPTKPPKKAEPRRVTPPPKPLPPVQQAAPSQYQPLECDRKSAEAVLERARSLAATSDSGDGVLLSLSSEWEYYSPGLRRSFVEAFSEADRCLQGRYRPLSLRYRGELVAEVGADGSIEMK